MRAKHLLPIVAVLLFAIPVVCAGTTLTIPYTDFNNGLIEHPTGYAADTWSVRLINNLVFGSNTSIAKIFIANSTGAGFFAINVNLAPELDNPNLYSADFYIATQVDPGPDNWTHIGMVNNLKPGKAYYIRLDETGTLSVTDGLKVLLTNPAVKFPAINIRTEGTAGTATAGYVQVTVDKWFATPTETVNAWIPVIIAFAMLGMALGLLKQLSK
ncbi:MAG: hypothetical protein H5T34_04305 [Candidatus Methanomethyliales bacterium]|nr:hypothetical protein [Candidatus Methanomethylicales archaeon]